MLFWGGPSVVWSWSLRFVGAVLVLVGGGPCDYWGDGDILLGWLRMVLGINRVVLAPRFSC